MKVALRCAAAALVFLAAACQQQPVRTTAAGWDALVDDYIEATFAALPPLAVRAGRHEFDGLLPALTRESFRRNAERLHAFRERASAFDAGSLDKRQRFERDYLIAEIDSALFWLEVGENQYRNPGYYAFILSPDVYLDREYAPLERRLRAYTKYLKAVPA